ncbi:hypothetical protein BMETH_376211352165, partial [methanotrophic bacterial endosymbiont of Bathymodiolus sp.]
VHLDGNQVRHDASVCQDGVFDIAVEAIKMAGDQPDQPHMTRLRDF